MFLRSQVRKKDGKEHTDWSVVENQRLHDGRVVQRQVPYLGEVMTPNAPPGSAFAPASASVGRHLHRDWFERTALADLLGGAFGLAEIHRASITNIGDRIERLKPGVEGA